MNVVINAVGTNREEEEEKKRGCISSQVKYLHVLR